MTRVLSLIWYKVFPAQFGGQKGIAEFTQYLSRFVEVHVLCSENNKLSEPDFGFDNSLPVHKRQFFSWRVFRKIRKAVTDNRATHLLIEHPYYGLLAVRIARRAGIPLVVHAHNLEFDRFREMGRWWWPILYLLERYTLRQAELTMFKTLEDRDRAIRLFGLQESRTMLVPFGITRKHPATKEERAVARKALEVRHGIPSSYKILLFNGTLDYEPNARALRHLVADILPALSRISDDFMLVITGRNEWPEYAYLKELRHDRMLQAGHVAEVETYFLGADLFLNPVDTGGGIKVKLMEALSYGLPVLSYRSGARGIDPTVCGGQLVVVEDRDVRNLVEQIPRCWNSAGGTPSAFFDRYQWESIVKEVADRLSRLRSND
jgi:glycosyltransferase involved in cell wall biosynthesis